MKTLLKIFVTTLVFLVSACGQSPDIRFATSKNLWNILPILAAEKGFFASEGLKVEMIYLQGGRFCLDALLSESADLGAIVEVNVAYAAFTKDPAFTVIANLVSSTSSAVVARTDGAIYKPADLHGKKLLLVLE